jgi:prepilin-type N-terminal cleavage/methylation domain-containing protein
MKLRSVNRGITLLEVLASLVIIGMLAGVCVPMLRSAGAVIGEPPRTDDSKAQLGLEAFADAIMKDPAAFAIDSLDELTTAQIVAPEGATLASVTIIKLAADSEDHDFKHEWLVLHDGEHRAIRFHWPPPKQESTERLP